MLKRVIASEEFIDDMKRAVRVMNGDANEEIKDLIEAAVQDMSMAGVVSKGEKDPLSRQAIKLYCKAHYGYDKDTEKFLTAYQALVDSMALSGEYGSEAEQSES